jgi:hypothetical protein
MFLWSCAVVIRYLPFSTCFSSNCSHPPVAVSLATISPFASALRFFLLHVFVITYLPLLCLLKLHTPRELSVV